MNRELTFRAGTLSLAAREWGEPAAPPLLALHGWLDNAASFDRLAPLLPRWRTIALDLPGHGYSQHRPPGVPYHFVDFVADVVRAADALALEQFALLGHSLGAGIASFVAAVLPQRVRRLVLLDGFGPFSGKPAAAPAQLAESIAAMQAQTGKRAARYPSLALAARARQMAGGLDETSARVLSERGTRRVGDAYEWRADSRLRVKSPQYLSEPQVAAYLRAIRAPTLLVRAADGIPVRYPQLEKRFRHVRNLRIQDVRGGHHVHLLEPAAEVAGAVRAFLAEA